MTECFDVIVLGGGQAGLCAAITAAEAGCTVCILEAAPEAMRGGNSRHTRNMRVAYGGDPPPARRRTASLPLRLPLKGGAMDEPTIYSFQEYLDDILRVTEGGTDRELAELMVRESASCVPWLRRRGVDFQPPLSGTLHLGHSNAFFLGGGKALVNALFRHAESLGVKTHYEVRDVTLDIKDGRFSGLRYLSGTNSGESVGEKTVDSNNDDDSDSSNNDGMEMELQGRALVAAAGGFEANLDWLAEAWGEAARNFIVRGSPYNRGDILRQLLDSGARATGDPKQCHAVAVDGRAPKFDGGIVSRVDCVPLGIVVNRDGLRFYDEGEDFWPKRYAVWGRLVAGQPGQVAFALIDSKVEGLFMPSVFPPAMADTIGGLATELGLPVAEVERTVAGFNAAAGTNKAAGANAAAGGSCNAAGAGFDHRRLDGCRTDGLSIPKSNWARPLDSPPFRGYMLRPGITFTYMGLKVDSQAQVLWDNGTPAVNIYAAGEIMGGNILGRGYIAGMGMTIGNVFGRIAGREATRHAS